jgi:hypothetical protein
MELERLGDLSADWPQRIKRDKRVLEDESDLASSDALPFPAPKATHITAEQIETGGLDVSAVTGETKDGPGRDALARSGLADQSKALTGAHGKRDALDHLMAGRPKRHMQVVDSEHLFTELRHRRVGRHDVAFPSMRRCR